LQAGHLGADTGVNGMSTVRYARTAEKNAENFAAKKNAKNFAAEKNAENFAAKKNSFRKSESLLTDKLAFVFVGEQDSDRALVRGRLQERQKGRIQAAQP
jgi:hypothetical protein